MMLIIFMRGFQIVDLTSVFVSVKSKLQFCNTKSDWTKLRFFTKRTTVENSHSFVPNRLIRLEREFNLCK